MNARFAYASPDMPTPPSVIEGSLRPGASPEGDGFVFRLFSRPAIRAWLMFFDSPTAAVPTREWTVNRDRFAAEGWWTIHVPGIASGQLYAWRLDSGDGRLDPEQWLLDPAAAAVAGRARWGDPDGLHPGSAPRNGAAFPKSVVWTDSFDWSGDRPPRTPWPDTILYELHPRGFTVHPSSGVRTPGTYRGLTEKIPHLRALGITAVELLPVSEFDEMEFYLEHKARRHLRNFWGYSPQVWTAPQARYASAPGAAIVEFQTLVRALHRAGIEVILDVVFNHTAEWDEAGPVWSFKGTDPDAYYLRAPDGSLANYTGCGNSVNGSDPVAQELILHTLRLWKERYRVDGFRFDLASALTRGPSGEPLPDAPLFDRIAADPALKDLKLIAEPWDAAGLYQVGSFPVSRYAEWNGRFRDDVRRFWSGGGRLGDLATRLCGSSDLYDRSGEGPCRGVNYVACHDGFTLADLVSYARRHNEANGENNRDGEPVSFSVNHGVEGPTEDPAICAARRRHVRNLLATLFLSRGVPMLMAGDEFGRTQQGNNNAYAQDNEISWVDWSLRGMDDGLEDFTRRLIAFRKAHPVLRRNAFYRGADDSNKAPDIVWFGPGGAAPDWETGRALACRVADPGSSGDGLLFLFNGGGDAVSFSLPAVSGGAWRMAWSTQETPPRIEEAGVVIADAASVTAWEFITHTETTP